MSDLSVPVRRHFTKEGESPYKGMTFVGRASSINKLDGTVVFEAKNVMVPDFWDQTAVDILAQKYFRRKGCDQSHLGSLYRSHYANNIIPSGTLIPGREGENDVRETVHRIVGCWTYWGQKLGYFKNEADAQTFYDELSYMMAAQRFAPNSPQWFNTGLNFAYGITGNAQGHYYVDPQEDKNDIGYDPAIRGEQAVAKRSKDSFTHPATSACFIQSVKDDLVGPGGIADLWTREARVFKFGGGSGTNFSNVRGTREPLSGGGTSSGLMSFLNVNDRAAGSIKSGGTTRRAAKMVILNADHPDIETFIRWKVIEERKVAMLVAGSKLHAHAWVDMADAYTEGGKEADPRVNVKLAAVLKAAHVAGVPVPFLDQCLRRLAQGDVESDIEAITMDWEGDGFGTVGAQNSNNSVRVTDAFMEAVIDDGDWNLTRRIDGSVFKALKARDLWDQIVKAAWMCADPGLQFDTTYNNWHTGMSSGRINATNPCSEYAYLDDTACNLASVNLCTFLNADGSFDIEGYEHACYTITIALEITVAMSQYPSEALAINSYNHRTLGLGYANLGAMLMRLGVPYDSSTGRSLCSALTAIMTACGYTASAEMANVMGPYPAYEENGEHMLRVLRNHKAATTGEGFEGLNPKVRTYTLDTSECDSRAELVQQLIERARKVWHTTYIMAEQMGLRNAQISVLAPTGTIGLIMSCDTTGVEPDFAMVKFKKLAGGGYLKLVNNAVPQALTNLGYKDGDVQDIMEWVLGKTIAANQTKGIKFSDLVNDGIATIEQIHEWDDALPTAFDPSYVFPEGFYDRLMAKYGKENTDLFMLDTGGRGTLEGAPHLRLDHINIFDCANKCGRTGTRFIAPLGHLKMMAAAQPFISGSISKTVNMPAESTYEDVANVYRASWEMGIKSIALYRDGSKFSQPLSTTLELLDGLGTMTHHDHSVSTSATEQVKQAAVALMESNVATRRKLPMRRIGYTQAARIGDNMKVYVRTGEYPDGTLGEIFLDTHKEGAMVRSMLNCFAIAVSLGLQYGVPLEEYCDAFIFTKFEPNGGVRGHDLIKRCTSMIDFIFRDLAVSYLGRTDLAHVKPEDLMNDAPPRHPVQSGLMSRAMTFGVSAEIEEDEPETVLEGTPSKKRTDKEIAQQNGFSGNPCPACGQLALKRAGTCECCASCGATTGCS